MQAVDFLQQRKIKISRDHRNVEEQVAWRKLEDTPRNTNRERQRASS